jgi:hypothetical protein
VQFNELLWFNKLKIIFPTSSLGVFSNKVDKTIFYDRFFIYGHALIPLLNYLVRYPLYSEKNISLERFKKIFYRLEDGRDHSSKKALLRYGRLIKKLSEFNKYDF